MSVSGCTVDVRVLLPGLGTGLADDEFGETGGDELVGDDDDDEEPNEAPSDEHDDDEGAALDLGEEGLAAKSCQVAQHDGPLPCDRRRTSGFIEPVVAWTWTGPAGEDSVLVTPLVANLTDDNHDGNIDLCDTPDIVVIAVDLPAKKADPIPPGRFYVIDGGSGQTELIIDHPLDATATPALADLDGDGVPELIAFERDEMIEPGHVGERRVVAFKADGELLWVSDTTVWSEGAGALAVADLDADGSPEILAPEHVLSADGELLWAPPQPPLAHSLPVAADLDLDGRLEVLFGGSVYDSEGELLFDLQLPGGQQNTGVAAIANFDADPYPEIYIQSSVHRILEHDGTPKAMCPGGAGHPVAIEDLDGDGQAEILSAHGSWFHALSVVGDQCVTLWSSKLDDPDASASGTAFDLLADGRGEAIYADLSVVRVFDDQGEVIALIPRVARSSAANPVVVDADNDGAAELILVGSEPLGGDSDMVARPSVILIQNADDSFAPTRRIWNQHAYHGTNVREDGRVPAEQPPHWLEANSFRTNSAPSYAGDLCQPVPIE
ncbi:MAG: VCBS repeat-containing protein [Enhygromyxa sp.]